MNPRVSVIIPVYNGEKEIETAVRSAVEEEAQFPTEIIVVDDGSADGTVERVARLAEEYPFVRLIVQENAGPAAARNRGIREAKGDYVLFLDSDDAFLPGAVRRAVLAAEGKDLAVFGYVLEQDGEGVPYRMEDTLLSEDDHWEKLGELYRRNLMGQVWAKVFSTRFLKEEGILFPERMWGEDRLFLFEALEKAKTVAVYSMPVCRYIQRKGSLVSRFLHDKAAICLEIDEALHRLADKKGVRDEENEKVFSYMYVKSLISSFATLFSENCPLSFREKRDFVKKALEQKEIPPQSSYPASCGTGFRALAFLARTGSPTLNLFAAWGVWRISRALPRLFRRAKHAYNKKDDEAVS